MKDNDMTSQFSADMLEALKQHTKETTKPMWWNVLERFGLPTLILLAVGSFVGYWGNKWLDHQLDEARANRAARQEESRQMTVFLKAQTEAVQAQTRSLDELVSEIPKERNFEREVIGVHKEQVDIMKSTADTIAECQATMHDVPTMRENELKLLAEIRDSIKNNN